MATRSLGTLTLDLAVKIGAFAAGMTQAERAASKSLGGIEKRASAFAKTVGASLGLSLAGLATGAVAAIDKAIDRMDELRDASIRLGIGVETLSAFSYAAQQTGTDIDALGKGFKILAKNMADALKEGSAKDTVFDALGVKVADAEGQLKDFEEIIPEIANAFAQLEDGAQKAALAQELFGKSGLDLIEFLNQGADGINAMTEEARALGLVFDQEAADKADKLNDTMAQLRGSFLGIATDVAIELLPTLISLAEDLKEVATEGDVTSTIATNLGGVLKGLADMAELASGVFKILGATFRGVGADLAALDLYGDATQKAFRLDIEGARESIKLAKEARKEAAAASAEIEEIYSSFDPANRRTGPVPKTPVDSLFQVPGAQPFSAVPFSAIAAGQQAQRQRTVDTDALAKALAGINPPKSGGGGSKARTGKSDEEREAEAIRKEVDQLNASYREQIALFGETSEASKLRYQFEQEDLSKLDATTRAYVETQREQAIAQAEKIDQLRAEAEVQDELNRVNVRREEATQQVLDDIRIQGEQLGMTAEALDTYNKLLYAGVDANDAYGQSIVAANEDLWAQREAISAQIDVMDLGRESARSFLSDLRDGLREGADAWDILKDAIDNVADALFDMIAKNLVKRALGEDGSSATGSAGGMWAKIAGWLGGLITGGGSTAAAGAASGSFVGPRAMGGVTVPGGLYPVNERGTELFSYGGKDYLMIGAKAEAGQVKPIKAARTDTRSGDTIHFNFAAPDNQSTVDQALNLRDTLTRRGRSRMGAR